MKTEAITPTVRVDSLFSDLMELAKARLSLLVVATTLVGFILGSRGQASLDYLLLGVTVLGTALCAAGAGALNQWWERDLDARMKRTSQRPLPSRRMSAGDALLFGLFCSGAGLSVLYLFTNFRAAFLAFATIAIYVLVYTPLKRMTSLNTLVGAIPGALPPLIGWVAACGQYSLEGGLLFMVMWFWQMPHFLAIAWMYKDDYAGAGFVMLPNTDPDGFATARQSMLYSLCLLMITLLPTLMGFNSAWYFLCALLLGAGFCFTSLRFLLKRDRPTARVLFFASIIYLPILLVLLVVTQR